jgi:hypothetical protein
VNHNTTFRIKFSSPRELIVGVEPQLPVGRAAWLLQMSMIMIAYPTAIASSAKADEVIPIFIPGYCRC